MDFRDSHPLVLPLKMVIFLQRAVWSVQGFTNVLAGQKFNYYPGDWYWIPSRAIPGESITEFPFFTFLYADPHAHLFSLPLTLIVLLWAISVLFMDKEKWKINIKHFFNYYLWSDCCGCFTGHQHMGFPGLHGYLRNHFAYIKSLQSDSFPVNPFSKGSKFKGKTFLQSLQDRLLSIAIFYYSFVIDLFSVQ